MYKIILGLMIALGLQGFESMEKYKEAKSSPQCHYIKRASVLNAKKARVAYSYEQAKQFKDIADNLFEQNKRCLQGVKQRTYQEGK